jgi:hypothetical protein
MEADFRQEPIIEAAHGGETASGHDGVQQISL